MKKLSVLAVFCLFFLAAFAADRIDLRQEGHGFLGEINPTDLANPRAVLGLHADNELKVLSQRVQPDGSTVTRFQQTFQGVPVWGEHVIMHQDVKGGLIGFAGRAVYGLEANVKAFAPGMSARAALEAMKAQQRGARDHFENEHSDLVVYVDDNNDATLAYSVNYFADSSSGGSPTRPYFIVDANTGKVLRTWEGLAHAEVGTGPGGNEKMGQYEFGTDFGYLDVSVSGSTYCMNNAEVKTVDLNHGTSGSTQYCYTGPRNTKKVINGAYSPLNDAHYYGGVVYDMFNAWVGVPPLTFQLQMRVHYSTNYENAFWNGSAMTFGDGATTFHPLTALDVSGHEVAHGFTEQNSALVYSGMSGGMNEAYSDMAGEASENFMRGSNDFEVGADIFKAANRALRYMYDPPADGRSIDNAADFTSSMDVHYSSGVYNKAFYILATTPGWNTQKAFQVFSRANQDFWTPSSTFNAGACGVADAATVLGFSSSDVDAAFAAVGVICGGGGGCASNGASCNSNSDCCSNKCRGKSGNKTCR